MFPRWWRTPHSSPRNISIYLYICLSIYPYIYQSIFLSNYLTTQCNSSRALFPRCCELPIHHRVIYLPIYLSIYISIYLPIYLPNVHPEHCTRDGGEPPGHHGVDLRPESNILFFLFTVPTAFTFKFQFSSKNRT